MTEIVAAYGTGMAAVTDAEGWAMATAELAAGTAIVPAAYETLAVVHTEASR